MTDLQTFLTTGVFAFIIAFARIGTVVMLMPGIGNTFVPPQIRLLFGLAFAFVVFPLIQAKLPAQLPAGPAMLMMLGIELTVGFFIGTIARALMAALDTAGMIISTQSSLANAQLFNPAFQSQGSVLGTFIALTGILLLFATNLYHLLLIGVMNSYEMFPVGNIPEIGSMMKLVIDAVTAAFMVGIQITAPFILIILLMYIGMAVMTKLMPQVQVFMIAVPVQIMLCLVMLALVGSSLMLVWIDQYEKGLTIFLTNGG